MGAAKENLEKIVSEMPNNSKVVDGTFVTNIAGKDVAWDMTFQFNLDNEDPFNLVIKDKKATVSDGKIDAEIELTGDPNSIVKICNGKGDFTHAISREEITVAKGKVMDVIRLTKAITLVLQARK